MKFGGFKVMFCLQTFENAIFDYFKGNNSALSQKLWDTQLYHTF